MEPIKAVIHYYPRCIRLIWEASRLYAVLAFSMNIVSAAVPAAQIWIAKIVIDSVVTTLRDGAGGPMDWNGLLTPIAAVFAVWFVGSLCGAAANGLQEQVGMLVRNHSQYLVLDKAAKLDIAFFETPAFFDEMAKAREGFRAHNLAVLSVTIVSSAVSLLAMLGLLITVHWFAVLLLLVTAAPQVIVGDTTLASDSRWLAPWPVMSEWRTTCRTSWIREKR